MSEQKDWKETDELLAQLRAKVAESSAPENTTETLVSVKEDDVPVVTDAIDSEKTPYVASDEGEKSPLSEPQTEEAPQAESLREMQEAIHPESDEQQTIYPKSEPQEPMQAATQATTADTAIFDPVDELPDFFADIAPVVPQRKADTAKQQDLEENTDDDFAWIDQRPEDFQARRRTPRTPRILPKKEPVPSKRAARKAKKEKAGAKASAATPAVVSPSQNHPDGQQMSAPVSTEAATQAISSAVATITPAAPTATIEPAVTAKPEKKESSAKRISIPIQPPPSDPLADEIASMTFEELMSNIFDAAKGELESERSPESAAAPQTTDNATPDKVVPADKESAPAASEETEATIKATATSKELTQAKKEQNLIADSEDARLFSSLSVESAEHPSQQPAFTLDELAEKEAFKHSVESSEEDLRILLDMDYEDELGTAIGFDKIREYRERGINGEQARRRRRRRRQEEHREFENPGQDIYWRKDYAKRRRSFLMRFACSVLLFVLIFFYEYAARFPTVFKGPISAIDFPRSYILFGIQLLIFDTAISARRLYRGILDVIHLAPTDQSICAITVLITYIYHIALIFLTGRSAPVLFLSPAAAVLLFLSLADLLDYYREFAAFQVVSSRRQKYALLSRISVGGAQNNARERLAAQEKDEQLFYARPVGFVRNYFQNTEKRDTGAETSGIRILVLIAAGIAFGLYCRVMEGKGLLPVRTVFVTFLMSLPIISLLATPLPMFMASLLRLGKKGAIIGTEPIKKCGKKTTLVLPDSELFDPMQHEQFELFDGCNVEENLIAVRALLDTLQSPLARSVAVDAELRMDPSAVTLTDIDHNGVCARLADGRALVFGSATYLKEKGISVKPRGGETELYRRLLLFAVNGKCSAVFLARYKLSSKAKTLLIQLKEDDVSLAVRTKDPAVRNTLFKMLQPDETEPIRVIKPSAREMDIRTERVDTDIVALGSSAEACRVFLVCRRVRRTTRIGKWMQTAAMILGGLMTGLFTFFGKITWLTPARITLYLFLWCIAYGALSYFLIREDEE